MLENLAENGRERAKTTEILKKKIMKRRIKLVRNDKTEAFSEGLNRLLGEIREMTYIELQTCLSYFAFVMARLLMSSEALSQFDAQTKVREIIADMKAPCIFGALKAGQVEFPQEIKSDEVCTFLGGNEVIQVWGIDLDD